MTSSQISTTEISPLLLLPRGASLFVLRRDHHHLNNTAPAKVIRQGVRYLSFAQEDSSSRPLFMRSCPFLSKEVKVLVLAAVLLLASSSSSTFFSVAFPSPNQPSRRPPTSSSSNDNSKMEEIEKQVSEWNIIDKQKNTRRRPQHKHWNLPSLQYIPPPDDGLQFEPFMLLLVGMPGSGKSTFAKALVEAMPYKFTRINQDELGNRKKCEAKARIALEEGKCPVIDRCNFDFAQRKKWFDIANERKGATVPVDCINLHVPIGLCVRRCEQRKGHETVAPKDARMIINKIKDQFRAPNKREPFRRLDIVRDSDSFNTILEQCLTR